MSKKYRIGPKKLKRLQQKLTFRTPRGYYDNVNRDVLQRVGLIGTIPIVATNTSAIIIEDDDNDGDADIDFQVEQFKDHLNNTHEKWHYTVDVSSNDDDDDDNQLLFAIK